MQFGCFLLLQSRIVALQLTHHSRSARRAPGSRAGLGQDEAPVLPDLPAVPSIITMPPQTYPDTVAPPVVPPPRPDQPLIDRYQQALEAQQEIMRGLITR